ncbi:carboxymuconolactone decarboxylase family protein [Burkholderia territorii]|uniref:carboxymuconolactone decarboxylase family protein n=1 Tax=Burkholderia territorii TaxID=1503055 RepID=UPI000752A6C6|nr:carboxymuconolactone decarboxylase family protein [Burkholderia territorii]KVQ63007.1 4-carboxymuconolactone decarboxylase [Burkholderia territorii]
MNKELFDKGLAMRRAVVGDQFVDAAFKNADEFSMPMQELVTEFCWGEIWSRPDLDRRSRSILNLGMIAALNRPEELAGHIRGAITNGVTKAEIRECFLQVAVYCGMPAGLGCFKVARQVFADMGI